MKKEYLGKNFESYFLAPEATLKLEIYVNVFLKKLVKIFVFIKKNWGIFLRFILQFIMEKN